MKTLILLTFFLSLPALAGNLWPQQWHKLNGDIQSLSYEKEGKPVVKVAFLDADSNLRIAPSGKPSANASDDVQVLPCVGSRLAQLVKAGYLIAIVSNQGGVSKGYVTFKVADQALKETMRQVVARNKDAFFHWYDFATDYDSFFGNDAKLNKYRKPGKGMALSLERALEKFGLSIDKEKSFMVGDSLFKQKTHDLKPNGQEGIQFSHSDRCFAQNYGIRYFDPADFFAWNSKPLFNTQFFDNIAGGFNIDFYHSYPEAARHGGPNETLFCTELPSYKKYSQYIEQDLPLYQWQASYQCDSGTCVPAYEGNNYCPEL